jgi:gas vesicle protein
MPDDGKNNGQGSSRAVALAMLVGGVVGGSVGLLLAPDSGRRTRERLRDLVGEARERTLDTAEELRDRVEDLIDQGRGLIEANKAAIISAYEAGREAFYRERDAMSPTPSSTPEGPVSIS